MAPPSKRKSGAAVGLSTAAHIQDGQSSSTSPLADVVGASRANDPLPVVKVNKVNIAEIKTALDDIVKKHLANQSFTPSLLHPTVHLSLGYGSILFALGGMAYTYTYKMEFKESRPALVVAVVGYFTLQTLLWAWKRWVEQGEVFSGRRRRLVKRIETDQVQITSSTSLSPPLPSQLSFSPHTRPSSPPNGSPRPGAIDISTPISPVSPITGASPSSAASLPHSRDTSSTSTSTSSSGSGGPATPPTSGERSAAGPTYILQIELATTSNNGKSLLHKARSKNERSIADFVDEEGGVEEGQFGRWLDGLLGEAGLVGAEDEGVKNE